MSTELTVVDFQSLSGIDVHIDAETVISRLTIGQSKPTPQEVSVFLRTCQAKKLDPFENGEVYLMKYRDDDPAKIVVGYTAYIRRADRSPDYRGFKAGIVVAYTDNAGNFRMDTNGIPITKKKEGASLYEVIGEVLIGGWCEVYRSRGSEYVDKTYMEVSVKEYSTEKSNWNSRPATMIRKVAISQAFRNAFPNEYEGLYTEDEMIASGAIPAFDADTGEIVEDTAEMCITRDQAKEMMAIGLNLFGRENNQKELQSLWKKYGYEGHSERMPVSVYEKVMTDLNDLLIDKQECEKAQNIQDAEYTEVIEEERVDS